jgi:hypothetical protein
VGNKEEKACLGLENRKSVFVLGATSVKFFFWYGGVA